jgi:hypothetical protein
MTPFLLAIRLARVQHQAVTLRITGSATSRMFVKHPMSFSMENAMNVVRIVASCLALVCLIGAATARLPIRKYDLYTVVEKVVPATGAEKKDGIVVTVFLKGRKEGVPINKDTAIHRQMGKLVPEAEVGDIKAGSMVSIWIDSKKGVAEGVLIFP